MPPHSWPVPRDRESPRPAHRPATTRAIDAATGPAPSQPTGPGERVVPPGCGPLLHASARRGGRPHAATGPRRPQSVAHGAHQDTAGSAQHCASAVPCPTLDLPAAWEPYATALAPTADRAAPRLAAILLAPSRPA